MKPYSIKFINKPSIALFDKALIRAIEGTAEVTIKANSSNESKRKKVI